MLCSFETLCAKCWGAFHGVPTFPDINSIRSPQDWFVEHFTVLAQNERGKGRWLSHNTGLYTFSSLFFEIHLISLILSYAHIRRGPTTRWFGRRREWRRWLYPFPRQIHTKLFQEKFVVLFQPFDPLLDRKYCAASQCCPYLKVYVISQPVVPCPRLQQQVYRSTFALACEPKTPIFAVL